MSIAFRSLRRTLLGFMASLSCLCIILACYLRPCFLHSSSVWVLVAIPLVTMCGSLWSIVRKPAFRSPQSVALEVTGFFAILPFELILAIFVLTVVPKLDSATVTKTFFVLEVLIFGNGAVLLVYTVGLLTATILTALSFDTEVWYRDIDASPSPFPVRVLVAYVFPCFPISTSESGPDSVVAATEEEDYSHCLPGCNCTKPTTSASLLPEPPSSLSQLPLKNESVMRGSRSQSLVRLPNAIERRTSIAIAFDVL